MKQKQKPNSGVDIHIRYMCMTKRLERNPAFGIIACIVQTKFAILDTIDTWGQFRFFQLIGKCCPDCCVQLSFNIVVWTVASESAAVKATSDEN